MVLSFLLALGLSTTAQAKDRPTVAVVGVHDEALDPAQQRMAVETLSQAITDDKRFEVMGPDDVARALAGREDLVLAEAYLTPGRRLLEDGRILHDQAQPEEAIPVLEQAVDSLSAAMAGADATRELWEALLYLGASHQELGHDAAAEEAWSAAVAINSERQPDAARLAPTIVRGYLANRDAALKNTGGMTLKVQGQATIEVNGRDQGSAPVKLEGMPAGTIHVRARGPAGAVAYRAVQILPGTSGTVELELGGITLPSAGDTRFGRIRATTDLYKALGKESEVDLLLVAGGHEGTASVQLYAPPADAFSNALEVPYQGDTVDELANALPGLLEAVGDEGTLPAIATSPTAAPLDPADNVLLAGMLLDPKPLAPPPPPRGRRTGAIVAGGVGAVLIGGAVTGVILATGGDGNRGTIIVGPVP